MKFYAVAVGRFPGIYTSWEDCKKQVDGFSGAKYKSFPTREMAEQYLNSTMIPRPSVNISAEIPKEIPKDVKDETRTIVYTDGSCKLNQGGWGFIILDGQKLLKFRGKVEGKSTNQIAELYAIKRALEECPSQKIDLYTDSNYSIGCLTLWWPNWNRNGWKNAKGESVVNKELIKEILQILETKDVKFHHVYGHQGNVYNEMCDRLAEEGRLM